MLHLPLASPPFWGFNLINTTGRSCLLLPPPATQGGGADPGISMRQYSAVHSQPIQTRQFLLLVSFTNTSLNDEATRFNPRGLNVQGCGGGGSGRGMGKVGEVRG